jgi:hypothetical protein
MARQTEKTVEIQGRKFTIRAFDALTGAYIAFTLMEKMMPMGIEEKVAKALQAEGKSPDLMLPQSRALMTKGEFNSFIRDCLSVVSEQLKGRDCPVLNKNGSWGVADIENNTMLLLLLVINALAFNIADFFTGDGLKDLMSSLQDLKLFNM